MSGAVPGIFNWRAIEADALMGLGRLDEAENALDEFEAAIPRRGWRRPTGACSLSWEPGHGERGLRPQRKRHLPGPTRSSHR